MSYLEKLLNGYEVKLMSLEEIATFRRGSFPQPYGKSDWYDGEDAMPFVQVVDVSDNLQLVKNTKKKISILAQPKSVFVPVDRVIVTLQGSIGRVAITQYDSYVDRTIAIFEHFKIKIDKKYFAYQIEEKFKIEKETARGNIIKTITKEDFKKFQISVPCPDNSKKSLEIQQKIVAILDSFTELITELTAELTAELTNRKFQYSYFREKLLRFEKGEVEWKSLGEVVLQTANIRWRDTNRNYLYIDLTSVCREKNIILETTEINSKNAPSRAQKIILKDDIIFATTRPTQQRLCLITEDYSGEIASTGYCVLRANKNVVLPKWIYFWITSTKFKNYLEENQSGSAYPAISDAKVKEFQIPIPSLVEQNRIVSILDKFDMLTTSISEGLPKEIELRKKQYEYYRDLLLTFPKDNLEE